MAYTVNSEETLFQELSDLLTPVLVGDSASGRPSRVLDDFRTWQGIFPNAMSMSTIQVFPDAGQKTANGVIGPWIEVGWAMGAKFDKEGDNVQESMRVADRTLGHMAAILFTTLESVRSGVGYSWYAISYTRPWPRPAQHEKLQYTRRAEAYATFSLR